MKSLKLTPKKSKFSKVFSFQNFYAFFPKFATDFVEWNVEEGHKKKMCCRVGFSEQFIAVSLVKIFQIAKNLKLSNKEVIGFPVVFQEKVNAMI